ncbi:hypothetical protein XFF7767_380031 [Xanthomonas citri pv. fuscans]|nr:hypothetical protein XFF6990_80166 [Xanthomonas citri pv. fuscans]SON98492.1 hypothetical protein XFF6960_10032 [Xanthomonas citri pv. fuscans]SOO05218.1 hypothetical protein XFF7767_380031 [Xanthomonas citri pv. fuscans]SOO09031.1 hypothetical protein XFF6970_300125 [Xanthomonas citri pv. fuscans]SOO14513.1 hypothetical protein XFF7766_320032 [Xanthomonas citri pv. fuscans]
MRGRRGRGQQSCGHSGSHGSTLHQQRVVRPLRRNGNQAGTLALAQHHTVVGVVKMRA